VQLAGLCHDLGHGPFSHMFESVVADLQNNENQSKGEEADSSEAPKGESKTRWKHEENTIKMMNNIFDYDESVKEEFSTWGLDNVDKEFIRSLIQGKKVGAAHFSLL